MKIHIYIHIPICTHIYIHPYLIIETGLHLYALIMGIGSLRYRLKKYEFS